MVLRTIWKQVALNTPLAVDITFFVKRPKTVRKRPYPSVKPDLDNLIKMLLDACNKMIFTDDALICELSAKKIYAEEDSALLIIKEIF